MTDQPLRIAIVGAGVIGAVHARLVDALGQAGVLAAIIDVDASRGNALAKVHGVPAYRSATEAYRTEQIDALGVSAQRASRGRRGRSAGGGCRRDRGEADRRHAGGGRSHRRGRKAERSNSLSHQPAALPAGGIVHPFVHRRGAPGTRDLRCRGVRILPTAGLLESGDWRGTAAIDGGGALMNQGIHALDLLLWMLGNPVSVSAKTADWHTKASRSRTSRLQRSNSRAGRSACCLRVRQRTPDSPSDSQCMAIQVLLSWRMMRCRSSPRDPQQPLMRRTSLKATCRTVGARLIPPITGSTST